MLVEEEKKHNAFMLDATLGPGTNGNKGEIAKNAMDENTKAVIIMNAKCLIQNVNKVSAFVFEFREVF
jgi:hypothetical protein